MTADPHRMKIEIALLEIRSTMAARRRFFWMTFGLWLFVAAYMTLDLGGRRPIALTVCLLGTAAIAVYYARQADWTEGAPSEKVRKMLVHASFKDLEDIQKALLTGGFPHDEALSFLKSELIDKADHWREHIAREGASDGTTVLWQTA